MSTRSNQEMCDAYAAEFAALERRDALSADRRELLAAVTQQWDPWERIPGQPPNCRHWRGHRGEPERVEPGCLLLRVSPDAWYEMLADPRLFDSWKWNLFVPNPARLAGVETAVSQSLPSHAWRLMLRGNPATIRAEGTYGRVGD